MTHMMNNTSYAVKCMGSVTLQINEKKNVKIGEYLGFELYVLWLWDSLTILCNN